jgi:hypothetical protein
MSTDKYTHEYIYYYSSPQNMQTYTEMYNHIAGDNMPGILPAPPAPSPAAKYPAQTDKAKRPGTETKP